MQQRTIDPAEWIGFSKAMALVAIERRDLPQKWHEDVYGEAALLTVQAAAECHANRRKRFKQFLAAYLDLRLRNFIRGLTRGDRNLFSEDPYAERCRSDGVSERELDQPCRRRRRFHAPPTEEQLAELAAAVKKLPAKERKAIEAVYLKRKSQAEHGKRIGVSQRTVSRMLQAARQTLAKMDINRGNS